MDDLADGIGHVPRSTIRATNSTAIYSVWVALRTLSLETIDVDQHILYSPVETV